MPTHVSVHWINSGARSSFATWSDAHGTSMDVPGVASSHAEALLLASKAACRGPDKVPLPIFDHTNRLSASDSEGPDLKIAS